MPNDPNLFNEQAGLLRRGSIDSYDPDTDTIKVKLNFATSTSSNPPVSVPAPHTMFYNNGIYMGTLPVPGTPVVVGQGSGGQYYFVSYLAENLPILPQLNDGEILIQTSDLTKISLDTNNNIIIGSDADRLHINTNSHFISSNIDNEYSFTQASRRIVGVVKRDLVVNTNFSQNDKLESDDYDPNFYIIPMDPNSAPTSVITGTNKNPPFVEHRELIYEFEYDTDVGDDLSESALYGQAGNGGQPPPNFNRRTSRADTLSLTLAAPNYLIESIKGTVIDIFGNILDMNRSPLAVGQGQNTINPKQSTNQVSSFLAIKALERKSLAYHFELNARKDLTGSNGQVALPDINSSADHARNRARFFFDVDKEGQFKLQVPASSETGNIGLLVRYENFSTFTTNENNNPNQLTFNADNMDIYLDSFAEPTWTISNNNLNIATPPGSITIDDSGGAGAPLDRIAGTHIMHGTAYHDILQTCYTAQDNKYINYQLNTASHPIVINDTTVPPLTNVVSKSIPISGTNAAAGGRSGVMNFDGSIEMNIGANTVDRQSLWLDTAGGIVGNIGRDLNGRSAVLGLNGDMYMQIGGFGVVGDARFATQMNGPRGATLDLRIYGSGQNCHWIRCDDNGITIMTPGNMQIHSAQDLTITADHNITIECETLTMQGRMHLKEFGGAS